MNEEEYQLSGMAIKVLGEGMERMFGPSKMGVWERYSWWKTREEEHPMVRFPDVAGLDK